MSNLTLEDQKTLKAVMFLTIKELANKLPNDEMYGKEVRKLIIKCQEESQ